MTLQRDADTLTLSIADDGRGGIADAAPGMGIANMRERAASLPHGRFFIDSGPANGTLVRISFSIAA